MEGMMTEVQNCKGEDTQRNSGSQQAVAPRETGFSGIIKRTEVRSIGNGEWMKLLKLRCRRID